MPSATDLENGSAQWMFSFDVVDEDAAGWSILFGQDEALPHLTGDPLLDNFALESRSIGDREDQEESQDGFAFDLYSHGSNGWEQSRSP